MTSESSGVVLKKRTASLSLAIVFIAGVLLSLGTLNTQGVEIRNELDLLALSPEALAIAYKIQCPVCDGQSITESNATIAKQMRVVVQELVDAGQTEEEILAYFEERYGPAVLREPRFGGISLGVWVVPPIVLLLTAFIVGSIVRQWRRSNVTSSETTGQSIDPADEEIVARELDRLHRGGD